MNMNRYNIAVLPGDGIGPEVIEQGIKVLDAAADEFGFHLEYCFADIGAIAIDKFGDPLPEVTLDACKEAEAVYMGAIGHPKYDNDPSLKVRPEQGLLKLRKELQLFANIRPVKAFKGLEDLSPLKPKHLKGTDLIIYRELTGGIYFGERGWDKTANTAYDTCSYSKEEIIRIADLAFEQAQLRRKVVTLVDKANVLDNSRLWRATVTELAKNYPDVELNYMFVDNAAMQLILNPAQFDIVLTSNMFGDILSDEASVLTGSLGMLPSASIGASTPLFEPVHGSYPQAAGQNKANPLATILSGAMLLDHIGELSAAKSIRAAVQAVLDAGLGTEDLSPDTPCSCSKIGDLVASAISNGPDFKLRQEKVQQGVSTII